MAEILYYDPFRLPPEQEQELGVAFCQPDEMIPRVDILSLYFPLFERSGPIEPRFVILPRQSV